MIALCYCSLWADVKHFRPLERSHLLLLCGIGYNVLLWSLYEFKSDLLHCLHICSNIILYHINDNPMEQCFKCTLAMIYSTDLLC